MFGIDPTVIAFVALAGGSAGAVAFCGVLAVTASNEKTHKRNRWRIGAIRTGFFC